MMVKNGDGQLVPVVFFNQPLNEQGQPIYPLQGQGGTEPEPKKKALPGNLNASRREETEGEGDAEETKSPSKAMTSKKGASSRKAAKKSDADRQFAQAEELVADMLSQLEQGFGIWLPDGVTTDLMTGCLSTRANDFERAIEEMQVDKLLVEMVIDQKIHAGEHPRIEWNRKDNRILLIQ